MDGTKIATWEWDTVATVLPEGNDSTRTNASRKPWTADRFSQHVINIVFGESDSSDLGLSEIEFIKTQTCPLSWIQWNRLKKRLISVIDIEEGRQKVVRSLNMENPSQFRRKFLESLRIQLNDRYPVCLGYGAVFDATRHSDGYQILAKRALKGPCRYRDAVYASLDWAMERMKVFSRDMRNPMKQKGFFRRIQTAEITLPGNILLDAYGILVAKESTTDCDGNKAVNELTELLKQTPLIRPTEVILKKVELGAEYAMEIVRSKRLETVFEMLPYLKVTNSGQFVLYERHTQVLFRKRDMFLVFIHQFRKLQKILEDIAFEMHGTLWVEAINKEVDGA